MDEPEWTWTLKRDADLDLEYAAGKLVALNNHYRSHSYRSSTSDNSSKTAIVASSPSLSTPLLPSSLPSSLMLSDSSILASPFTGSSLDAVSVPEMKTLPVVDAQSVNDVPEFRSYLAHPRSNLTPTSTTFLRASFKRGCNTSSSLMSSSSSSTSKVPLIAEPTTLTQSLSSVVNTASSAATNAVVAPRKRKVIEQPQEEEDPFLKEFYSYDSADDEKFDAYVLLKPQQEKHLLKLIRIAMRQLTRKYYRLWELQQGVIPMLTDALSKGEVLPSLRIVTELHLPKSLKTDFQQQFRDLKKSAELESMRVLLNARSEELDMLNYDLNHDRFIRTNSKSIFEVMKKEFTSFEPVPRLQVRELLAKLYDTEYVKIMSKQQSFKPRIKNKNKHRKDSTSKKQTKTKKPSNNHRRKNNNARATDAVASTSSSSSSSRVVSSSLPVPSSVAVVPSPFPVLAAVQPQPPPVDSEEIPATQSPLLLL